VYTGGEQRVPRDVKRVRIAENVDTIPRLVFDQCQQLTEVEGHNRLRKIEEYAFCECPRLKRVKKMQGVVEMKGGAFYNCSALSDVDFEKLEIIGQGAFYDCKLLRSINLPSVRMIGQGAFMSCNALTDAVFCPDLERIEALAFLDTALRRIVIPLKDNLIVESNAFSNLSRVDALDGGIHETISSLHLESWRNKMQEEIDRINQTLPNTRSAATAIQQWIGSVLQTMEHYKTEHKMLVKEAMTLLELALWKAKLLNETDEMKCNVDGVTKKARIDAEAARREHRVTCGASIVIKNVLPFLALKYN
jgi:hypothetical protein